MSESEPRSSAAKCRANGWTVGTVLEGDEGFGPERIVITAVGERLVCARKVVDGRGNAIDEREGSWDLTCRDWKAVGVSESELSVTVDRMIGGEALYAIAEAIAKLDIFGAWVETSEHEYVRPSPGQSWDGARVRVWESYPGKFGDPTCCQDQGWYWEIGLGIMDLSRIANYDSPHATAEEAMKAVDSVLKESKRVVLAYG